MEQAQQPMPAMAAPATGKQASQARWMILAVLFMVTTINYADRATISIAGPEIKKALGLSPVEMGYVFSAFAWSYVLAQLPGGWLLDRFGSKITYFFSIFLWSLFTVFTGAVGFFTGGAAVAMLFLLRFAVGAAEAPSFPGNSRITSAWFPMHERGLASAIFNSAQYFATVLFAPIMGWLVHSHGWQSVFYVMGGLGIGMAFIWLRTIHSPKDPRRSMRKNCATCRKAAPWSTSMVPGAASSRPAWARSPASRRCSATACCWACTSASIASPR
ncbi:MFS transporter [Massilia sp. Se16.2.3]|uniref:MFS transporter n=1 Tax=unclassified Massilia TaxID=2609279 RepID=UPI0035A5D28A